ncbi:MAG: cytochrome C [Rhodocyclaceae bacterium]|jgi:mono/diheme cytochrome c family protein|nr:cytochrome C [Rhodocyclaceae bacterium]
MKTQLLLLVAGLAAAFHGPAHAEDPQVARGRYLTQVAGCNDCHTPGYAEQGGQVPESRWLTGSDVGFSGPWGVSYPANLRLVAQKLSLEEWRVQARAPRLPPMPWFALRDMSDGDVDALYRYLRGLGPAGVAAPAPVPPGQPVATAHIVFVPQAPARAH